MKRKIIALVLAGAFFMTGCSSMNHQERTCTITGKESVRSGDGNQYRVYTKQCGTLTVSDTVTQGRWDSSEFYSQLEEGATYNMMTGGYRNGFMSMFPNILEAEKVS